MSMVAALYSTGRLPINIVALLRKFVGWSVQLGTLSTNYVESLSLGSLR